MNQCRYSPWNLFITSCNRFPDNVLTVHNNRSLTYVEINDKITTFTTLINDLNFQIGGVFLPNSPEFIIAMLGLNKLNKVTVPVSYQLKGESLREVIRFSDIELIITDNKGYREISGFEEQPDLKWYMVLQETGDFEIFQARERLTAPVTISNGVFCICFTSGSTGKPKGILLSNEAITGNALAVADYLGFESHERTIIPRSLAQASPISGDILMAISRGGGIILLNDIFHPGIFLRAVQDHQATNVFMIRTMLAQILDYPQLSSYDLRSLRRIMLGGMLNPKHIFEEAAQKLPGIGLYNAYGISEASARVSFLGAREILEHPGSIGKPISGCSMRILKEGEVEAVPGEVGEIYIKSSYVMNGYYKQPDLTAETLTAQGLRTGDLGYRDSEGYFYVVGRRDDLIIQGGTKVYPVEIEDVLLKHPGVNELVVFGMPDEILGQKIVALIRPFRNANWHIKDIYAWCTRNLEAKKVPREIHFVDEIPRNIIGKISKEMIREYYRKFIEKKETRRNVG